MKARSRKLTDLEKRVVRRVRAGRAIRFDGDEQPAIAAAVVRRLLLGPARGADSRGSGPVVIENAKITGVLDLRDHARVDGAPLPALELIGCTIERPIHLENVHIRRLRLSGSRLVRLSAAGARIDGTVRFDGVAPVTDGGECRLDLRGARIGGDVEGAHARLRAPVRPEAERQNVLSVGALETGHDARVDAADELRPPWYALGLGGAEIAGRVALQPCFEARGGVSLNSARVGGDVWAAAALVTAGEGEAWNAQGMRTDGNVALRAWLGADGRAKPFRARGAMTFYGARIGGTLDLSGSAMTGPLDRPAEPLRGAEGETPPADRESAQLNLTTAVIEGPLFLSAHDVRELAGPGEPPRTVTLRHTSEGGILLAETTIRGGLYAGGARFGGTVQINDARIAGDLNLGGDPRSAVTAAQVALDDAQVEGSIVATGVFGTPGSGLDAFRAPGVRIGGQLRFAEAIFHGDVRFTYASVGRDVDIDAGVRFRGRVIAPYLRVGGSVHIAGVLLGQETDLRQIDVAGHLKLERVAIRGDDWTRPSTVSLQDAHIAGEIRIIELAAEPSRGGAGRSPADAVTALRTRALSCYPGWRLVEAIPKPSLVREVVGLDVEVPADRSAVIGFLWRERPRHGGEPELVLLNGRSQAIHELNATGALRLESESQAKDYLRFFTSYVWGDEGPFRMLEPGDLLQPDTRPLEVRRPDPTGEFRASGVVAYGDKRFLAGFSIRPDGVVEMLDDRPLGEIEPAAIERCVGPFRFAAPAVGRDERGFPPSVGGGWQDLSPRDAERILSALIGAFASPPSEFSLQDARADRLDDDDGAGLVGRFRLHLDGFTYARAPRHGGETDLWRQRTLRRRLRGMELEERLDRATFIRRRRVRSHLEWWVVEAISTLSLSASGDDLGFDRFVPGTVVFFWKPVEDESTVRAQDTTPANVVLITGDRGLVADANWVRRRLGPAEVAGPAAALDALRVAAAGVRTGGAATRIAEPGEPSLESVHGPRVRPIEIEESGDGFRIRCTLVTTPGAPGARRPRTLADLEFHVGADGSIRNEAGGEEFATVENDLVERQLGAFRLIEGADLDPRFASAWGVGDAWWEEIGPQHPDRARMLRDLTPALRTFLDGDPVLGGDEPTGGDGAPELRVRRDPFTQPDERVLRRLRWLHRQYRRDEVRGSEYRPHPYEVAAAAFRNEGADSSARRVLSHKQDLEYGTYGRLRRAWGRIYGLFFDYGLSPVRAMLTTLGLWLIGVGATVFLNETGMLIVDFTPSATVAVAPAVVAEDDSRTPFELGVPEPSGRVQTRVRCDQNISALVYPADLMVPILDFGQERRCQIASTPPPGSGRLTAAFLTPWVWKFGQGLYAGIGAICVSFAILTVSGVLRRYVES